MESTRNRLIELLETSDNQFVSGQSLSNKLNISRSAVWKHMKELEKDGYKVEGVSRKGYRIVQSPDKVSANTIQWGLKTSWLGKRIIHKTSTTTTQQIAHQVAIDNAEHGTVIIADEQTNGKGRMDRQWYSTKNKGIWLSIILRPNLAPVMAPQLTLLAAIVLADAITEHTDLKPRIKWPNDILINDRKTAGILTEMQAEQDQIQYVVIGIGINVNHEAEDFQEGIRNKATSLYLESDTKLNIKDLIQHVLVTYEKHYDQFIKNGFPGVKQKWESYGYRIGEQIKITTLHKTWEAKFLGIAEDGALLTQTSEDGVKKLYAGEIEWFARGDMQNEKQTRFATNERRQ